LATESSPAFGQAVATDVLIVLVPIGSVEPHGPHLGLATDCVISEGICRVAAERLFERGFLPRIAPTVSYGVTECARAFAGAVSIPAEVLTKFLRAIVDSFLRDGAMHVCLVNSHLEPDQDRAVRAAIEGLDQASVACPLIKKYARTLSEEFQSGACHAGQYETSLVLAERPDHVDTEIQKELEEVPISLSRALKSGVTDFVEMGLTRAYAGNPRAATAAEGKLLYEKLADMVVSEVMTAIETARTQHD
jgi:creatinine amidohydrolase